MKTLSALMVLAGLVTIGAAAHAEKKPVVCFDWTSVAATSTDAAFAVCRDGKRPVILTSVTAITLLSEDGVTAVKAIVGYR